MIVHSRLDEQGNGATGEYRDQSFTQRYSGGSREVPAKGEARLGLPLRAVNRCGRRGSNPPSYRVIFWSRRFAAERLPALSTAEYVKRTVPLARLLILV